MNLPLKVLFTVVSLIGVLLPAAHSERNDPGSLLIFPEFDSRPGSYTFLTVTNVNPDEGIRVHFNWVDEESCLKTDAWQTLTPLDTITFLSSSASPNENRGYCFAYARGMASPSATDFDYLIGTELTFDGWTSSEYQVNALVYEGQTGEGNPTDLNGDGNADLDGVEYGTTPDLIAIPRFFGQIPGQGMPRAELIFIGLTGTKFNTSANFLIYNDNEEVFSAQHSFDCWERVSLLDISGVFSQSFLYNSTNHDPNEVQGFPLMETGWFQIDGSVASSTTTSITNPAMLAIMVEVGRLSSASLPFTIGEQFNGSLLPKTLSGN